MERLLASANKPPGAELSGVILAQMFPDDTLTPKLVALAEDPKAPSRLIAIEALASNRTDDGVRALKTLLNSRDQKISKWTEDAIRSAYTSHGDGPGRPLRPDDFDPKYQHPEQPTPAK
jgi:hypothetical protein